MRRGGAAPSLGSQHLTAGGRLGLAEDWEISVQAAKVY